MLWTVKNGEAVVGSTKMSYVSFGWGDSILILLPGLSDGLTTVKGKALLLAKPFKLFFEKYTVYMFSRKNNMPEQYSIREMAADQALAMNALGIGKASVMGVSQGGTIAQYLAIDYSDLVEKLVLTVTAPCLNDITDRCVRKWIDLAKQSKHASLQMIHLYK